MFKYLVYLIFLLLPFSSTAQFNYNFFISNSGKNSNTGTTIGAPKQTLSGAATAIKNFAALNGNVMVGLASGSVFNESLAPDYPIGLGTYFLPNKSEFAILNGSDVFNVGWIAVSGTNNTWQQNIQFEGFSGSAVNSIGAYSYISVFEIDKELEKTAPFTARKVLQFERSLAKVETTPGSFYEPVTNTNPVPLSIHTSDGKSPNNHQKYRYEVTVRDRGIDAYPNNNNRFESLWVRGYGAGYGLLPGGANSSYNKVVFGPGAGIHHLVTKNATFNNCLFLPGARNTTEFAVVFYDVEGFARHNKMTNTIFLDVPSPVYAHTSYGTNHGAIEFRNVFSFADTIGAGSFISMNNTDTVLIDNVYSDRNTEGYNYGSATFADIKNAYFKDVNSGISFQPNPTVATLQNVFIRSFGSKDVSGVRMQKNTSLTLSNSIIHLKNSNNSSNPSWVGSFVEGSGETGSHINATNNIFICDVARQKGLMTAATNTDLGIGTSPDRWDNNVYVLLQGINMVWSVRNKAVDGGSPVTLFSYDEWKRQSGQDKNSLFFDLRNDPRGLKAIFLDPDNGDYTLANTIEGNKIRALKAGMLTPLTCFLKKPTYEQAAEMIKNDKLLNVGSCKNPCQKASVTVTANGNSNVNGQISICANDELTLTGAGSYKENDSYYHQADNTTRYLWWFSDVKDTSGNYLHTVKHRFSSDQPTDVRLQMVDANGCSFDTTFTVRVNAMPAKPNLGNDTSLCTGQTLQLGVIDSVAGNVYSWSTGAVGASKIAVTEAGKYWVQSETSGGCKAADTINVINQTPLAISLGNDTMYCSSANHLLTPVATGNIASYHWNTGATTNTLPIDKAGTYIVTAKDTGVCIAADTITITDNPINHFSLGRDTAVCVGSSYVLNLHPPASTVVKWNDGSNGYSHSIAEGTYSVSADYKGCTIADSLRVTSKPIPVVKLPSDTTICSGYNLPLSVSYPAASFVWSTGSGESSIAVSSKGTYWVEAELNGCTSRDTIIVQVQNCACNVEIPNAFSPNGDGVNDVIRPKISCYPTGFNLSVFNRNGQLVFNTRDYNTPWNGEQNGKPLAIGTYYYVMSVNNESKPISGSITLLR